MRGFGSISEPSSVDDIFARHRDHDLAHKAAAEREHAQIGVATISDKATLFRVHEQLQERRKQLDELAARVETAAEHIAGPNRVGVEGSEKAPNVECLTDVLSQDVVGLGEPVDRISRAVSRINERIGV